MSLDRIVWDEATPEQLRAWGNSEIEVFYSDGSRERLFGIGWHVEPQTKALVVQRRFAHVGPAGGTERDVEAAEIGTVVLVVNDGEWKRARMLEQAYDVEAVVEQQQREAMQRAAEYAMQQQVVAEADARSRLAVPPGVLPPGVAGLGPNRAQRRGR